MGALTEISWAHSTFNPWIGCQAISPGCDHCYAEAYAKRVGRDFAARTRTSEAYWRQPLKWNAAAIASGEPHRVFCASLADVFDNEVPAQWRADLFRLIEATPALTWMLLTKRIGNVAWILRTGVSFDRLPDNVWLGITVVNQEEADRDIPKLLKIDASLRWLSCEPLLGPIELRDPPNDMGEPPYSYLDRELDRRIEWVIVGGESGNSARPMDAAWARAIRDQCAEHGAAFHFKQWGGVRPKSNGHLLEGVEHRAFPIQLERTNPCAS